MDKDRIVSAISIEFGLSNNSSEKIVNSIFFHLLQGLMKNNVLKIRKFGKFKLLTDKKNEDISVRFTPSKKLSSRVNGNYENLKKIRLRSEVYGRIKIKSQTDSADKILYRDKKYDGGNKESEAAIADAGRKLIPDDLIKLHEEIVKAKDTKQSDTDLWG